MGDPSYLERAKLAWGRSRTVAQHGDRIVAFASSRYKCCSTVYAASHGEIQFVSWLFAEQAASSTARMPAPPKYVGTVPPTVTIVTPGAGAIVSGNVPVVARASDHRRVARLEIRVDGETKRGDTTSPTSTTYRWDTTKLAPGRHQISAVARNVDGLSAEAAIEVVVERPSEADHRDGGSKQP
jgi:hypothetical protein